MEVTMSLIKVYALTFLLHVYANGRIILPDQGHSRDIHEPSQIFRLVGSDGGIMANEGRLEVWHDGRWGTVCDDLFGVAEASLVCTLLGFQFGGEPLSPSTYGPGRGPILLNMLDCPWAANSLAQCSHKGWGRHFCHHGEDVGVRCRTEAPQGILARLVGGNNTNEGRLQVWHERRWGTVRNSNWGPRDAAVICRQLGYNNGGEALMWTPNRFGERPHGPVWLDNLICGGKEPNLGYCPHLAWYPYSDNPSQTDRFDTFRDVSVKCYRDPVSDFQLRLLGGSNNGSGVVNIYHNGNWWYVCDDWWGNDDATVVCKTLGFSQGTATHEQHHVTDDPRYSGYSIGLDMVYCPDGITDFRKCFHRGWGYHSCYSWEIAGVVCE